MSTISFSGLGSNLDTSSWVEALIAAKKTPITNLENKVTNLKTTTNNLTTLKGVYSSMLTNVLKLTDSNLSSSANVFAQTKSSSSDTNVLTVSNTYAASAQTLDIQVKNLATNTSATGSKIIGSKMNSDSVFTDLGNGSATAGSFTFYVDNKKYGIEIEKGETLEDIKTKMVDATKSDENPDGLLNINIVDGKFNMDAGDKSISIGSSLDKSNFATIIALKKDADTNSYTSSRPIIDVNMNDKLLDPNAFGSAFTAGTFKIGNAEFTIDETTSLNTLINRINSSASSGVSASFNATTGEFNLASKNTGSFNIALENGTSNFLEQVGLLSAGKVVDGTQTLGKNALLTINGKEVESYTNTVTSESSGINGLVLNLNKATETGKNVTVKLEQDTGTAVSAVNNFISAFNKVISNTDSVTKSDTGLRYETSLSSLRNNLRSTISNIVDTGNTSYRSLADIGISTGAVGTGVDANTNQLVLDEKKFLAAMADDPEAVKQILIGSTSKGTEGVVGSMRKTVEGALNATDGYFASRESSIKSQITRINEQITRKTASLNSYKSVLEAQFSNMDSVISKLQSQYGSLTSALGLSS